MSDQNQCCKCVEQLAEQLENLKDDRVLVFEKNAFIIGTVKDVKDKSVLVLEDVQKTQVIGNVTVIANVDILFISICEITEFAPFESGSDSTLFSNLSQSNTIRIL